MGVIVVKRSPWAGSVRPSWPSSLVTSARCAVTAACTSGSTEPSGRVAAASRSSSSDRRRAASSRSTRIVARTSPAASARARRYAARISRIAIWPRSHVARSGAMAGSASNCRAVASSASTAVASARNASRCAVAVGIALRASAARSRTSTKVPTTEVARVCRGESPGCGVANPRTRYRPSSRNGMSMMSSTSGIPGPGSSARMMVSAISPSTPRVTRASKSISAVRDRTACSTNPCSSGRSPRMTCRSSSACRIRRSNEATTPSWRPTVRVDWDSRRYASISAASRSWILSSGWSLSTSQRKVTGCRMLVTASSVSRVPRVLSRCMRKVPVLSTAVTSGVSGRSCAG